MPKPPTDQPGKTVEVPETPSPPDGRTRQLLTLQSIKRELADTIRKVKTGELDCKRAGTIIYGCSTLADIIKGADLETKVKRLEASRKDEEPAQTVQ